MSRSERLIAGIFRLLDARGNRQNDALCCRLMSCTAKARIAIQRHFRILSGERLSVFCSTACRPRRFGDPSDGFSFFRVSLLDYTRTYIDQWLLKLIVLPFNEKVFVTVKFVILLYSCCWSISLPDNHLQFLMHHWCQNYLHLFLLFAICL